MNKDLWEQIDKLKELAKKTDSEIQHDEIWAHCERKCCAEYIAAINPTMLLKIIAEIQRLRHALGWLAAEINSWEHIKFERVRTIPKIIEMAMHPEKRSCPPMKNLSDCQGEQPISCAECWEIYYNE